MKHLVTTVLIFALTAACKPRQMVEQSGVQQAWDELNNPIARLGLPKVSYQQQDSRNFLKDKPWTDYYWATYRMGIAYRWQNYLDANTHGPEFFKKAEYDQFEHGLLTKAQTSALSDQQVSLLSPAEKYDLFMGRSDFPLTKTVLEGAQASIVDQKIPRWYGICHGWAPASSLVPEPGPSLRIPSKDGKRCIEFLQSDLKALVSQAFGSASTRTKFVGGRCNRDIDKITHAENGRVLDDECEDVNPGAFHVIVTQLIDANTPFVADVTYSGEVWNQPIYGYEIHHRAIRPFSSTDKLADYRARGHAVAPAFIADVELILHWGAETEPSRSPRPPLIRQTPYQYSLELDKNYNIIGGEWDDKGVYGAYVLNELGHYEWERNAAKHPDFIWLTKSKPSLSGELDIDEVLNLAKASRNQPNTCGTAASWPSTVGPVELESGNETSSSSSTKPESPKLDWSEVLDVIRKFPPSDPLPQLPVVAVEGSAKVPLPQPGKPWTSIQQPRNVHWRPTLEPNQIFCHQFGDQDRCKDHSICGWSHGTKQCLYIDHGVCAEYPDRSWCLVTTDCKWVDANGKSTMTNGKCVFRR